VGQISSHKRREGNHPYGCASRSLLGCFSALGRIARFYNQYDNDEQGRWCFRNSENSRRFHNVKPARANSRRMRTILFSRFRSAITAMVRSRAQKLLWRFCLKGNCSSAWASKWWSPHAVCFYKWHWSARRIILRQHESISWL